MYAKKIRIVSYPPPADDAHAFWYILDSVDVRLPFVHPGVGWDDGGLTTVTIVL